MSKTRERQASRKAGRADREVSFRDEWRRTGDSGPPVERVACELRSARANLTRNGRRATREADHPGAAVTFRYHPRTHDQPLHSEQRVLEGAPHLRMVG